MTTMLFLLIALVSGDYFTSYSANAGKAVEMFGEYKQVFRNTFAGATEDDIAVAFSIVAPEVSCYDAVMDFVEVGTMKYKYVRNGECDYSIGYFQMKPSFVVSLEKEVFRNAALKRKYGSWLAYSQGSDAKQVRRERLTRLCKTEWQIKYLAIFVDIVKTRTASWNLRSNEERVRYWATMYNAGFYLSRARVEQRQTVKQFPRGTTEFNYSAVAVEFYRSLIQR